MKQKNRELYNWKEMIKKVIKTEAKTGIQPVFYI